MRLKRKTLLRHRRRGRRDLHRGSGDCGRCSLLLRGQRPRPQPHTAGRAAVTSMLVAFSFSSITCFRMTREDLIASFSVIDCKANHSLIALLMLKQVLVGYPLDCESVLLSLPLFSNPLSCHWQQISKLIKLSTASTRDQSALFRQDSDNCKDGDFLLLCNFLQSLRTVKSGHVNLMAGPGHEGPLLCTGSCLSSSPPPARSSGKAGLPLGRSLHAVIMEIPAWGGARARGQHSESDDGCVCSHFALGRCFNEPQSPELGQFCQ